MKKGISIHIGMEYYDSEHYGNNGKLRTCGKDSEDMRKLAYEQNFDSITVLNNEKGTRDAVVRAISNAAEELVAGDMLFISYSGHGASLPDGNSDEEDGKDESWCLFDGCLLDDELYVLWTKFAEDVRIMIVSDSCHSGTVAKALPGEGADAIVAKHLPIEEAKRVYAEHESFYLKVKANAMKAKAEKMLLRAEAIESKGELTESEGNMLKASVKLISGCQDDEFSYIFPNDENSLLTKELNRVWDAGQFVGTTVEFFEQVQTGVEEIAKNSKIYQKPNLYDIGKKNKRFNRQKPFGIYE